jgi:hypothetical protein
MSTKSKTASKTPGPQPERRMGCQGYDSVAPGGRLPLRWGVILLLAAAAAGTSGIATGVCIGLMIDPLLGFTAGIAASVTTFVATAYRLHRMLALR